GATGYELPSVMDDTLDLLREGAAPAALFAVGAQLVGFSIAGDLKHTLVLVGSKIVIFPLLVAGAVLLLADPHPIAFAAAVTTAALPAGVNPVLLAQMYGMFTRRASGTMFLSTLVGAITVTALIAYFKGQGLIGSIG
ncbi:MAG: AEC family transporter, partial [Pseudomonadota bacterium]